MKNKSFKMLMAASVGAAAIVVPVATSVSAAEQDYSDYAVGMKTPSGEFEYVYLDYVEGFMEFKGYSLTKQGYDKLVEKDSPLLNDIDKSKVLDEKMPENLSDKNPSMLMNKEEELFLFEDLSLRSGDNSYYTLDSFFIGENLTYTVTSTDENVADFRLDDRQFLHIQALNKGETTFTVVAKSKDGKEYKRVFNMAVDQGSGSTAVTKNFPNVKAKVGDKETVFVFKEYFGEEDLTYSVKTVGGTSSNVKASPEKLTLVHEKEANITVKVIGTDSNGKELHKTFEYVVEKGDTSAGGVKPVVPNKPEGNVNGNGAEKPIEFPGTKPGSETTEESVDDDGKKELTEEEKAEKLKEFRAREKAKEGKDGDGKKLPQTGAEDSVVPGLLGATLLALATALGIRRKQK